MGQEGSRFETSDVDSALLREYKHMKGGKKRLSAEDFEKLVKKNLDRQDSSSSRPASEDLETLKEVCADKNFIEFQDFLAWKIKTGTKTELPNLLTELFNDVDNGDGKLTPDELVELEGKLNKTISLEDAEQIITTWDSNGDGFFTVDEYIEYKSAQMN